MLLVLALAGPSQPLQPRITEAQANCPSAVSVDSHNGNLSINSAVRVNASGCAGGTQINYWVRIPASPGHALAWHPFAVLTKPFAWLDLSRNEQHATEFPDGTYGFAACAVVCTYSPDINLTAPAGSAGPAQPPDVKFNPWAANPSNMQFNRGLCRTNAACVGTQQLHYGIYYGFLAYPTNVGEGANNCGGNCFYQNVNSYFTNPNPGDTQNGFTQLVINRQTTGYEYVFWTFSFNVTYCRTNPAVTINNPTNVCGSGVPSQAYFPYDNATHQFWMYIFPAAQCRDTNYQCLRVFDNGRDLAEERMVNGGLLTEPFIQNETHPTAMCPVWGAQLNWFDYSMRSPCSLNNIIEPVIVFATQYILFQTSLSGSWNFLYVNPGTNGTRVIMNEGNTFDVYCGPFGAFYPAVTQMYFGTIAYAHPCPGGPPT